MLKDRLLNLYEFNCWGRDLVISKAEALTPEQFDQETRFPLHTLKETLVHTLSAELAYRKRCMGEPFTRGVEKEEFPDLSSIKDFWLDEDRTMRTYLATVDDQTLEGTVKYTTSRGDEYERVRVDLLFQLFFHSMQHRAEIAQMLTEFGHSPGNIDYAVYKYG
ncbi:MAG: DinB family protein [Anaerolineales bacterium]